MTSYVAIYSDSNRRWRKCVWKVGKPRLFESLKWAS
jgi:hypothetical protein